jgi:hypothetical protein
MPLSDCQCGDWADFEWMELRLDGDKVFWTVNCLRCEAMGRFMGEVINQRPRGE